MTIDIGALLQEIEAGAAGRARRRITDAHELDLFLIVDTDDGQVAIEISPIAPDEKLPGVEVGDVIDVTLSDAPDSALTVALLAPEFRDLFVTLASDLVRATLEFSQPADAARALLKRLSRWEQLLEVSRQGLSPSQQKGLFGELLALLEIAGIVGFDEAIAGWVGPAAGVRDFEIGSVGVEVKTTASPASHTVRISSERQLDPTSVPSLFLWCNAIERAPSGESLPAMVDRVRSLLPDATCASAFEARLGCVGYLDAHAARYTARYLVRATLLYRVDELFPRIRPDSLPNGVGEVRYALTLAACEPWRAQMSVLESELRAGPRLGN